MTVDNQKLFEEMTPEEMDKIIRKVKSEVVKKRGRPVHHTKAVRLHGYLPGKMSVRFLTCMDYAFKSGWIAKKQAYDFVNWAVERIITSIEEEMSHNPRFSDDKDNLT